MGIDPRSEAVRYLVRRGAHPEHAERMVNEVLDALHALDYAAPIPAEAQMFDQSRRITELEAAVEVLAVFATHPMTAVMVGMNQRQFPDLANAYNDARAALEATES